jgi:thioredoxin 1
MVKEISSISEIPSTGISIVDFFADWCGPCKRIAPAFSQLGEQFPTVSFLKVNVDESESMANEFSVNALPTFLFFKNGNVVHKIEGADLKEVVSKLSELSS